MDPLSHVRIAQVSHLNGRAEQELRARRQHRGDVLPDLSNINQKAGQARFVVQLRMDQVHLAQVRLHRVARHLGAMLDRLALMRAAIDA